MTSALRAGPSTLALVLVACSMEGGAATGVLRVAQEQDLDQVVTVTPASPRVGDTVVIRSVVRNVSADAVAVEARVCGLDRRTDLPLEPDRLFRCGAYSMSVTLAPGDSVVGGDHIGVIAPPPGTYTLEIGHLVSPARWVTVPITVQAR